MSPKTSYISVTDQFCGAGGSSLGAKIAGCEIVLAMNHWNLAIETHNSNFPDTTHVLADISTTDPRRYPATDVLITSPECFPAETLIISARGLLPISEVRIGDLVLTHLSRWRSVTAVMVSIKDTITIRGQGHRGLETTSKHPFYARRQSQKWNNERRDYDRHVFGEPEWVEAGLLMADKYRWASPARIPAQGIPPVEGPNRRSVEFNTDFWWMVGRWLGDGSVRIREDSASSEITICCGKHEVYELDALFFAPKNGPHARQNELHWRKREIRTGYLFECAHDSLARWLVLHFGRGAHHKTLPIWVLSMRQDWREALLSGYVSADGHSTRRYTSTATVSKRLALGIRLLVTGLGYHPTFGPYRHAAGQIEGRRFDAYTLWTVRWENNQSQRTGYNDGEHSWTLVKEITSGRTDVEVYNLSVAEDESFVADGIVVHNCTNHSIAKGVARKRQGQLDLWGSDGIDTAEERSRATMWDVVRFAEQHQYRIVIVENVVDARSWRLFDSWLNAMHALGYRHECVYFNSMFAHPTPQSRDRMYVVFWKKGNKRPDLRITPVAWCPKCEHQIEAVQAWKNAKRQWGKYGARNQYVYVCPHCQTVVEPYYYPAATAIDWSQLGERIGDRMKPLKAKTMERITYGLKKFGAQALTVQTDYTHSDTPRARPVWQVVPTQAGRQVLALVMPFIVSQYNGRMAVRGVEDVLPTVPGMAVHRLLMPPFIAELRNTSTVGGVDEALATVTAGGGHHGLVIPMPFLSKQYSGFSATGADEPTGTITTWDHNALVTPLPFLDAYYSSAQPNGVDEPMATVPTRDRHALVQPQSVEPEDCFFRMLKSAEIGRAMAFPDDYRVLGNERQKVKQYGNAVTPPVMQLLVERCVATFQ